MKIRTHSAAETRSVAAALASILRPGDLIVLDGDLGGGKTAFVQGACEALGVREPVTSPTFTIVQEYDAAVPLVHVDAYRLESAQELHDLGFDELADDDHIVFVEWGSRVFAALPTDHLAVAIDVATEGWVEGTGPVDLGPTRDLAVAPDDRLLRISVHGPHWHTRARSVATALAHHLHPAGD